MLSRRTLALSGLTAAVAAVAMAPVLSQQSTQPIARYTMDAGTMSGMAAMAAGGRGGGLGGIMTMMRDGNQVAHELVLRLGSSRSASGTPAADHFMPVGAGLGASVPLVSPEPTTAREDLIERGPMQDREMPRGRLLLFWGCGEHAPAGQPVVLDFARMARGEIPAGLYAQGLNLPDDWEVLAANSTTYGDWPNSRDSQAVSASSSLLGAHRVAGNYSPEISFTLAEDFMPALNPSGTAMPSGAVRLAWANLTKATGYYAWAIGVGGGGNDRDMVWWASSRTQQFGGPMANWISPSAAARYVEAGTLMAPGTTECVIPAEVKQAGGEALMTSLYAYGPQVDFAYPPRPASNRTAWRPEWIARVRYRSMAMVIPGMDMGMGGARGNGREDGSSAGGEGEGTQSQPAAKPRCRGGLRGIAERAAGLCE